jgi:hypothetical protein
MTERESKLRDQIAEHYTTYLRQSINAEAVLGTVDGCGCDEPCECITGDDARAQAAIHATLAQAAAQMANTLALVLNQPA